MHVSEELPVRQKVPEGGMSERPHVDENCWCEPRRMQICPVCNAERSCGECGDSGLVLEYAPDEPVVVVHNR